ncbi:RnfABCDGE type electron transport complex subunit G [Anaerosporobacter faecicola]|uniref:RnfABCDGE type electron transport complex subunit G n=1 Tax=Anaerosporobacter faecicola TaxID=2718714 RepID=UPI001438BD2A|nr:RnfABCDGE type electron transport complex subunit G [Anaerosporobacter faecicola]
MSNKKKNTIIKDALALFCITLVAGILLGFVYEITKDPIKKKEQEAKQKAYQTVFADAVSFKESDAVKSALDQSQALLKENKQSNGEDYSGVTIDEALEAYDQSDALVGYVMNVTTANGYGGNITISMGIKIDGTVTGMEILSINETAGLGMKATEGKFKDQFKDKNVDQFAYTKTKATNENEIDALSGATITTKAVTSAVNAGVCFAKNCLIK